jgi:hypothetical protein
MAIRGSSTGVDSRPRSELRRRVGYRTCACRAARQIATALGYLVSVGCGAPSPGPSKPWPTHEPSVAEWRGWRESLANLRERHAPTNGYTMRLALELQEPLSGQMLRARGAVGVAPDQRALRMILVGPGGATALDLWICGAQSRFAVPALDLVWRGDGQPSSAQSRGLPVGFLRWWLLDPLAGRLLFAGRLAATDRYVLRSEAALLDLQRRADGGLRVERRVAGALERVESSGSSCPTVRYREQSTGLDIRVTCEGLDLGRAPTPAALADPDEPTRLCPRPAGQP